MSAAPRHVPESVALSRLDLLTTAEGEILHLLGEGLAAPEIAGRLGRSKSTVETHIRHIGNKTGWRGQQRLTRLAMLAAARTPDARPSQRDPEVINELRDEIAGHTRSRIALEQVVSATADVTGEAFLAALCQALGQALGVRLAAVLEAGFGGAATLRTAACALDGALRPPLEFPVADSPLAGLGRREERFIAVGAAEALPRDPLAAMVGAQGCLGVPLRDGMGSLLGGVVLMHDGAIETARSPELIVRLFAGRAAAELERRRSDHLLRDSELRFRTLAEHSADIISRFDALGTRIYASPAVETILGWRPDEVVGHSGYQLVYAEDIERVGPVHHAALANPGTPGQVRWRGRHRDGSLIWLETVVRATPNAATGELEMLTVTRDVSKQQEAIERLDRANAALEAMVRERTAALATSERRWRAAIEHANDFISIVGPDLRVVFCNRTLPDVDPATIVGSHAAEHLAPECRDAWLAALHRVLATGVAELVEVTTLTANGRLLWSCRLSPLIVDGAIVGITAISRDVTADRRNEAALRESEVRYRNLVELLPDGIIVHDGATVRFASPAAAAMFGHPSGAAMVGSDVMEMVPPPLREIVRSRIERNLRDRIDTPRMRQTLVRRDGGPVEVETSATSCVFDGVPCVQVVFRACASDGRDGRAAASRSVNGSDLALETFATSDGRR